MLCKVCSAIPKGVTHACQKLALLRLLHVLQLYTIVRERTWGDWCLNQVVFDWHMNKCLNLNGLPLNKFLELKIGKS